MSGNRWATLLADESEPETPTAVAIDHEPGVEVLRGSPAPQPGLTAPAQGDRLGTVEVSTRGPWWVGVHGGAGESTMADLLGGDASGHRWPLMADSAQRPLVVLVARQNARGLDAAARAARDWAAGSWPGVDLLGLVIIAAAPGKVPKHLRSRTRIVAGGVPRTWMVPWIESLHLTGEATDLPRSCSSVLTDLSEAVEEMKERN